MNKDRIKQLEDKLEKLKGYKKPDELLIIALQLAIEHLKSPKKVNPKRKENPIKVLKSSDMWG